MLTEWKEGVYVGPNKAYLQMGPECLIMGAEERGVYTCCRFKGYDYTRHDDPAEDFYDYHSVDSRYIEIVSDAKPNPSLEEIGLAD